MLLLEESSERHIYCGKWWINIWDNCSLYALVLNCGFWRASDRSFQDFCWKKPSALLFRKQRHWCISAEMLSASWEWLEKTWGPGKGQNMHLLEQPAVLAARSSTRAWGRSQIRHKKAGEMVQLLLCYWCLLSWWGVSSSRRHKHHRASDPQHQWQVHGGVGDGDE